MASLVVATPEHIPAIMALERGEGYETLVGRFTGAEHAAEFADPGSLYLMWLEGQTPTGFVLIQGLANPNRSACLRRIAVAKPGTGQGSALLAAAIDHIFVNTRTHRLWLDVFTDNERGRRAYVRAGFTEEGVLRDNFRGPDGTFRSMRLMSILRPEWEAPAAPTAQSST